MARRKIMSVRAFDVAEAERWPLAVKALCLAAVGGAIFAIGNFLVLADLRGELRHVERHQVALRAERKRKTEAAGEMPALQAGRDAAASNFAALLRGVPAQTEIPALVENIGRAALARNLAITGIALAAEQAGPLYVGQPLALSVAGDYHAMGAFAADLAALPALVTLHDFELVSAANETDGHLAMTATAKTYRHAPGVAASIGADILAAPATAAAAPPGAAVAYRQAGGRSPFAPTLRAEPSGAAGDAKEARARQPLERHALAQLRLVGILAANGVRQALLHTPDGLVYRAAAGDRLGTERGRIRAVRDRAIDVVEVIRDPAGGWREQALTVAMSTAETVSTSDAQELQ